MSDSITLNAENGIIVITRTPTNAAVISFIVKDDWVTFVMRSNQMTRLTEWLTHV
jgi:hypothetical protein